MKKKIKVVVSVFVILILIGVAAIFFSIKQSAERLDILENADIDMMQVADGTYSGYSDTGLVKAEVSVEVKNHKIVNIELIRHENGRGTPAESILDEMISQNSDNVDAVSGATVSSETIRNAVNVALQKGLLKE